MSLLAALPMLFGVAAGRMVDRVGVRRPLLGSIALVTMAVLLPGIFPGLVALHLAAAGAGLGFMLFHVAVQHAVGEMSPVEDRKANFGWLALGFSISNFAGPTLTGLAIDGLGHRLTFLVLAGLALVALVYVHARRALYPDAPRQPPPSGSRSTLELLRQRELRHIFLVTGLLASAWDLFTFVMPIYGTQIGLSATTIGLILGSFAAATIVVRLALPFISRRVREWPLITATMGVACVAYLLFPLVETVPLLAAVSFFLGLGLGATQPSVMSLIYAKAPPGRAGEAVGVRSVVLNASHTVLPLAFGGVGAALGMAPVFWSMSLALAAGGWFSDRRRREAGPGP